AAWSGARGRPDWRVAYAYDRWRPTFVASYSDDTDPIRGGDLRTREVFAGALLPFRQVRWSQTLMTGVDAERDSASCAEACRAVARGRGGGGGACVVDGGRVSGCSSGGGEGGGGGLVGEGGAAGGAETGGPVVSAAGVFRRFFPRRIVVALRAAAAASAGD